MSSLTDSLRHLAGLYGVLTEFHDNEGNKHGAGAEALVRVLRSLGSSIDDPEKTTDAIRERELDSWKRRVEPVQLFWDGRPVPVRLRLPSRFARETINVTLQIENGPTYQWAVNLNDLPAAEEADAGGQHFLAKDIPLAYPLPLGYHRLTIAFTDMHAETMILSAPVRSFAPEPAAPRTWGVFAPLYALHSRTSWGAGDFSDLNRLLEWTAGQGGGMVATLPLLAAFLDEPFEPGPYSPASRLFWNEFYIDVSVIPELKACPSAKKQLESAKFQKEIQSLRAEPLVDYRRQMALKRSVLEKLAKTFFSNSSKRRQELEGHLAGHGDLETYARFRATVEQQRKPWRQWPERQRDGKLLPGDYAEDAKNYHLYVQWLCREQLQEFSNNAAKHGPGLYVDLPLGVNPDSYDVWRDQRLFVDGMAGGAPPDSFFPTGQNWGFPPQHPERMRESGYRYLRACLVHQMQSAGLLRIDHLMGLHRVYWIPSGMEAKQGIYVGYPANELYAVFSLESHRHRTVLIGEDLGTVPPEVPTAMDRHGLNRMYVLEYYLQPKQPALEPIFPGSVASVNTHDMPTFSGFLEGTDIDDRLELKVLEASTAQPERERRKLRIAMMKEFFHKNGFLREGEPDDPATLHRACLEFLATGQGRAVLVNLEDLWCEMDPQNVPGTWHERPNWQRRAKKSLEEIEKVPGAMETLRALNDRVHGK